MTEKLSDRETYAEVLERGDKRSRDMILEPDPGYMNAYVYRNREPLSDGYDDKVCDGSDILNDGLRSGDHPDLPCWLCNITNPKVYYTGHSAFIIIRCPVCGIPLVVSTAHTMAMGSVNMQIIQSKVDRLFTMPCQLEVCSKVNHMNFHVIRGDADRDEMNLYHGPHSMR